LTRRHLDMPSMQRYQRGAMPDEDDGRIRQNLAQRAVDFRFQLLVKRRCRLIEKQPIGSVENS
jgi:competence transcription factor ComK